MAETIYGTTSGGEQVRAFRLGGEKLSAVILDMGGTITEITVAGAMAAAATWSWDCKTWPLTRPAAGGIA